MLDLHLTRRRTHAAAVVDVSPGVASIAICSVDSSGSASVCATGLSQYALESRTPEQDIAQIGSQIGDAAKVATQKHSETGGRPVEDVQLVVHAPWVESRTVTVRKRFETEVKISDALIAKTAQEALAGEKIERNRVMEASVVRVELNGYAAANPAGQHAHSLDVVILISEIEPALKDTLLSAAGSAFPGARTVLRSSTGAVMVFVRESAALDHHYCVVDMGADSSHVVSVRGATIIQKSVPIGIRTVLARIGGGKQPEEILSALRMLERESSSPQVSEGLQNAIATVEPVFVKAFAEAVGTMAAKSRTANHLLLMTHPDLEAWLVRLFSRIDFAQFTVTTLPFQVALPSSIAQATGLGETSPLIVDRSLFNTTAGGSA
jgi:hypothetical protein